MSKEEKKINITDGNTEEVKAQTEKETSAGAETQHEDEARTSPESQDKEQEQKDPLAEAEKTIAELKDQLIHNMADFDNYRKRTAKEKNELRQYGAEKTIVAILPILDDMERAIANAPKAESKEKLEEGWELIAKKLERILKDMGVSKIDTQDADFNVDYHEAVAMVPAADDEKKGKVIDCVQSGYTLNDKVIRHAKVAVGN